MYGGDLQSVPGEAASPVERAAEDGDMRGLLLGREVPRHRGVRPPALRPRLGPRRQHPARRVRRPQIRHQLRGKSPFRYDSSYTRVDRGA